MLKHTSTAQSLIELLRRDETEHQIDTTTKNKMDTNPELKKTLKETFDSYLHEGLVLKLDSLLQD